MRNSNTPPVMHDVARHAGVSQKTVSRVINNAPYVREEVRDRVLKAIQELGYRPNASARALVTRSTATLGAVLPANELFGPNAHLHGIEHAAHAAGYGLVIASVSNPTEEALADAIARVLDSGAAGIVISGSLLESANIDAALFGTPCVVIGESVPPGSSLICVGTKQATGTVEAVEHLLTLGHQTVHHIAGPENWAAALERRTVWDATLRRHGRRVPTPVVGDWTFQSGLDAARELLTDPSLTAIFSANDEMALGAMRAAIQSGRRIPDGISIVGFDDTPMGPYLPVALTTVHQNFARVTERAVHAVIQLINGGTAASDQSTETRLVIRESTGRPPKRADNNT